jgi:alanine racemase
MSNVALSTQKGGSIDCVEQNAQRGPEALVICQQTAACQQVTTCQQVATCEQVVPASWVEIDAQALTHNIACYRALVQCIETPSTVFAVVLKSNAYGHGLVEVARVCQKLAAIDWLCTANVSEALYLRRCGITKPILALSYIDASLDELILHDIDVVVYDEQTVHALQAVAEKLQKTAFVHVKVDTGLSRLGVLADHACRFIQAITRMPYVSVRGVFTHLANSERSGKSFTAQQIKRLNHIRKTLGLLGIVVPYYHYSCTAALTAVEEQWGNFVRLGLGIYGLWPSAANKQWTNERYPHIELKPVMSWKTKVIQVKQVPLGESVGYGCTVMLHRHSTLAILPIGYWEGYDRRLSNKAHVMIRGHYAPVIGRVSMNLTICDVTDLAGVMVGDEVVLLGGTCEISADALAVHMGTIHWEVVTRINPLIPRILV